MTDTAERREGDEPPKDSEPAPKPDLIGELSEAELDVVSGGFRGARLLTTAEENALLRGGR